MSLLFSTQLTAGYMSPLYSTQLTEGDMSPLSSTQLTAGDMSPLFSTQLTAALFAPGDPFQNDPFAEQQTAATGKGWLPCVPDNAQSLSRLWEHGHLCHSCLC